MHAEIISVGIKRRIVRLTLKQIGNIWLWKVDWLDSSFCRALQGYFPLWINLLDYRISIFLTCQQRQY